MTQMESGVGPTDSRRDDDHRGGSRTSLVLEAAHIEFLDRLSATVRINTGHRLTKRSVIETLVSVLPMAHVSLEEVASERDLKEMLGGAGEAGGSPASLPRLGRLLTDFTATR